MLFDLCWPHAVGFFSKFCVLFLGTVHRFVGSQQNGNLNLSWLWFLLWVDEVNATYFVQPLKQGFSLSLHLSIAVVVIPGVGWNYIWMTVYSKSLSCVLAVPCWSLFVLIERIAICCLSGGMWLRDDDISFGFWYKVALLSLGSTKNPQRLHLSYRGAWYHIRLQII